jgi:hypothetical protein
MAYSSGVNRLKMDEGDFELAVSGDMIDGLHIERMDDDCVWGRVDMKDGSARVFWFSAKKSKLIASGGDGYDEDAPLTTPSTTDAA